MDGMGYRLVWDTGVWCTGCWWHSGHKVGVSGAECVRCADGCMRGMVYEWCKGVWSGIRACVCHETAIWRG